jgi:hypothetical protein
MADLSAPILLLAELSPPGGFSFPGGELSGWPYLAVCAVFFLTLGVVTGYFIWRKGNLQTIDAEAEIRKTGEDLAHLREDLRLEILELGPEREAPTEKSGK